VTTIRDAQRTAWANKVDKKFNTTDVPLEFCLLSSEVAEAFDAWRRGAAPCRTLRQWLRRRPRPPVRGLGEELADVAIFLLGLAQMAGVDLQGEVEAKLTKNAARVYRRQPNGKTHVRTMPDD
jgi:NTP pyrophosphatase (non-canonical NTP hydrolase)